MKILVANGPNLNLLGLREYRNYPSARFWEIAGALQCPAAIGCDAHSPADLADPENLREAEAFASRFGVHPMQDIPFRPPF